ncbi:MAG: metallophosphoesterase family protein [Phycisphaeraceae bacterium]|nr:metallophosphoesterase family protein [Phycisphaerales bacterium]MCB9859758.1 metallophosphoesterase family protein [Phycisphaeraceae bacterium]
MELFAFSDIHTSTHAISTFADTARKADIIVGAGDFATMRRGLQPVIDAIAALNRPTVLVHGNSESEDELRVACEPYSHLHVLHGQSVVIEGVVFFGLGGAVPVTPFGSWSVDLTEHEAETLLAPCPNGCVLVSHSPPLGYCDTTSSGSSIGSSAVLACIKRTQPTVVLCGHVHHSWGNAGTIGTTRVLNLGPTGTGVNV